MAQPQRQEPVAPTIATAIEHATRRLARAGVLNPRQDARLLIAHALGAGVEVLLGYPERELSGEQIREIAALVGEREKRRPIAQILGRREFWSREFTVTADVLDPRPDSESLIEALLAHIPDRNAPLTVLDFGTGTGCLLLALLSELPQARGFGVDISPAACDVARKNAHALGFESRANFAIGDWGGEVSGSFDVIVANPPYIPSGEIASLEPEVARFEPKLALDGGDDGLDAYRSLAPDIGRLLADAGIAVVEIGMGQETEINGIFEAAGLQPLCRQRDLAGKIRALVFHKRRES
jgi:release factor glutamine methyltransferase